MDTSLRFSRRTFVTWVGGAGAASTCSDGFPA